MAGITLAQLAQLEQSPMAKFMELRILRDCKVMELLPFETVESLKVNAAFWEVLPTGGAWRSLNEGYTSDEDGQLGEAWEALYAFGGDITFDNAMKMVKNVIKDPVQMQTEGKLKSMALQWNDKFINGDLAVDPKAFNGLKKRVAGMPARQTVYMAGSSSAPLDPVASAANARSYLNKLRAARRYCNAGKVSAMFMNEGQLIGFSAVLMLLQSSGNYLNVTKDQWGNEWVEYASSPGGRGVPLIDIGMKEDQATEIITDTEVAGDAGADSTSIYMVDFNTENGVYGIQLNPFKVYDPLNGGEMESKPSKLMRVDWFNGIASFGTRGIVRLRNIEQKSDWTE